MLGTSWELVFFQLKKLFLICCFFLSTGLGQNVFEHGQWFNTGNKFIDSDSPNSQHKQNYDTLTYKSLPILKSDYLVNTDCGNYGSGQSNISVAINELGNYMCVWLDERTELRQIDGQIFNANSEPIGSVIHVSENYNSWNSQPHIVYNYVTHEYIITWAETGSDIKLQRISNLGEKLGQNKVITDLYILNTNNPSAAIAPNGEIFVTWISSGLNSNPNPVNFKILNKDGSSKTTQKTTMQSPNNSSSSIGWDSRIASDSLGRAVVVWSTYVDNDSRIVLQAIDTSGNLINNNIIVSDSSMHALRYFPTVTSIKEGKYFIIYTADDHLFGRIYSIDNGFITDEFQISKNPSTWRTYSAASDNDSLFYVAYTGYTNLGIEQGGTIINKNGDFLKSITDVTADNTYKNWTYPKISNILSNKFFVAYSEYNKSDQDVRVQKFENDFVQVGHSVKAANDDCSSIQKNPIIKFNQFGEYLVVWEDGKTGTLSLSAQLFDAMHQPVSGVISVNDTARQKMVSSANIATDTSGSFIVSFIAGDYDRGELYLQKISRLGILIGNNKTITNSYYYSEYGPHSILRQNSDGNFYLYWFDRGTIYPSVYLLNLDANMHISTSTQTFFKGYPASPRIIFDIATNKNLDLLVLWADYNQEYSDPANYLKAIVYNKEGVAQTDTLIIDNLPSGKVYMNGKCEIDDNRNLIFVWSDISRFIYDPKITISRIYPELEKTIKNKIDIVSTYPVLQIIKSNNLKSFVAWYFDTVVNGVLIDDRKEEFLPIRIHQYEHVFSGWLNANPSFNADLFGDTLAIVFTDVKNADRGYDIYANIQRLEGLSFMNTTSQIDSSSQQVLYYLYPNPTNSKITLNYKLMQPHGVSISIFNVLGEKIIDLERIEKQPGVYSINFDTHSLSSGIYFLRFQGFKTVTQKFIIIK